MNFKVGDQIRVMTMKEWNSRYANSYFDGFAAAGRLGEVVELHWQHTQPGAQSAVIGCRFPGWDQGHLLRNPGALLDKPEGQWIDRRGLLPAVLTPFQRSLRDYIEAELS